MRPNNIIIILYIIKKFVVGAKLADHIFQIIIDEKLMKKRSLLC